MGGDVFMNGRKFIGQEDFRRKEVIIWKKTKEESCVTVR